MPQNQKLLDISQLDFTFEGETTNISIATKELPSCRARKARRSLTNGTKQTKNSRTVQPTETTPCLYKVVDKTCILNVVFSLRVGFFEGCLWNKLVQLKMSSSTFGLVVDQDKVADHLMDPQATVHLFTDDPAYRLHYYQKHQEEIEDGKLKFGPQITDMGSTESGVGSALGCC